MGIQYAGEFRLDQAFITTSNGDTINIRGSITEINIFEESGVKVLNGPYGPYVTDGKKNVRVPKDTDPKSLSEEVCLEMLKNAPKRRARFRRRKS